MFIFQLELPKGTYLTFMMRTNLISFGTRDKLPKKLFAFFTKVAQFSYFLIKKIYKGEKI